MAKIVILLNGAQIAEHNLDDSKEYVLGRGSQCDIILDSPDVSRQHAKIKFTEGQWYCNVISKFGRIHFGGELVESVKLVSGNQFKIPPFDIRFDETIQSQVADNNPNFSAQIDDKTTPLTDNNVSQDNPAPIENQAPADEPMATENLADAGGSDATAIRQVPLKSVLHRLGPDGEPVEEITLGAGLIEVGRSRGCQIQLQDPKASRKHFTLMFDGQQFVLTDLDSANQTYVNGAPVKKHYLKSGDEISVGEEKLRFELSNPEFDNLPKSEPEAPAMDSASLMPVQQQSSVPMMVDQSYQSNVAVLKIDPHAGKRKSRSQEKSLTPMIMIAVIVIIGAGALILGPGEKESETRSPAGQMPQAKSNDPMDKLTPEQIKFIDDTYNLAYNLYTSGRYELAGIEVSKIFKLLPNYKGARELLALSQQAIELKKQNEEIARRKKEQEELMAKVDEILDGCERLLRARQFNAVEDCVNRVADMDPESSRAQSLAQQARDNMEQIESVKEARAERAERNQNAKQVFEDGKKAFLEKRYPAAIATFNRLSGMSFDDTEGMKAKGKLAIKEARDRMLAQSNAFVREGKAAYEAKDYKTAIAKFDQALALVPDNEDAFNTKEAVDKELHIELKTMFSESVIEENLGNIESAKKKWRTIMEIGLKSDDYYRKAKMKLTKYEK